MNITKEEAENLYRQYGKPLEKNYQGKYVAIASSGKRIIASTLIEAVTKSRKQLGKGSFVFKIGPKIVGSWK